MTLAIAEDNLSALQLQAVAAIWKRERRVLSTSFGGTSMSPRIIPGQVVRVLCGHAPDMGDVVVCQYDNQLRVHRVVTPCDASRPDGWFLTWGDNNALPDEPAYGHQVIGVLDGLRDPQIGVARRLLVWGLTWRCANAAALARRVAWAYRVRAAWQAGPQVFVRKSIKAVKRGRSTC